MTALDDSTPIVTVALNRASGDVALKRSGTFGAPLSVLAERGADVPSDAAHVRLVGMNRARIGPAVRQAVQGQTAWVAVPRSMGTTDYLLAASVRSVSHHCDPQHPGVALLVVSPQADPTQPYRRALAITDVGGPTQSGLVGQAAVELASRTGAALDVVVMGVDEGEAPNTTGEWIEMIPVSRYPDLVQQAWQTSRDNGVEVRWMAGGRGSPAQAARDALARERYDVVIDGVGARRSRSRFSKQRDVQRIVNDPDATGLSRIFLDDDSHDVLLVLDAISLGIVPASAVRLTAAAAVAMGAVGIAAPTAAAATAVSARSHVSSASIAEAQAQLQRAAGSAGAAAAGLPPAKKKAEQAQAQVAAAEEKVETAREQAQPAADELAQARLAIRDARGDLTEAQAEYTHAELRSRHVSSHVGGGPLLDARDEAAADVADAEREVRQQESAAARAYAEYRDFEADVRAAQASLAAANDEASRAELAYQELARAADEAREEAESMAAALEEMEDAFVDQGLHAPAQGSVTSPFGHRTHPVTGVYKLHTGTDFQGTDGQYYAMAEGTVTYAAYDGAYGYMVKVDHGTIKGQHVESWYAHQPGLSVSVGDRVDRGQVIGRIGNSGYSTGPHAHVELRLNDQPVDLMPYIS